MLPLFAAVPFDDEVELDHVAWPLQVWAVPGGIRRGCACHIITQIIELPSPTHQNFYIGPDQRQRHSQCVARRQILRRSLNSSKPAATADPETG